VSECGFIRNIKTKKILKGVLDSEGFLNIRLHKNNQKNKTVKIHHLISKTYIPNSENKKFVSHKDKNKKNNNILNLEWTNEYSKIIRKTKYNIIMMNNVFSKSFNTFEDIYNYIYENKLSVDNKKKIYNNIVISLKKNIEKYGYLWIKEDIIKPQNLDEIYKKWNDLEVSNYGNVKNSLGILQIPFNLKNRYNHIFFNDKSYSIHRVVAELFIENNNEKNKYVQHIDGNNNNNKFDNLKWIDKHSFSVKKINQIDVNNGKVIKTWNNINEICVEFDVKKHIIHYVLYKNIKKPIKGFIWTYV
jgi:hypothetical protein